MTDFCKEDEKGMPVPVDQSRTHMRVSRTVGMLVRGAQKIGPANLTVTSSKNARASMRIANTDLGYKKDIHQIVGDNSVTQSISTEYLSGQVMAQKILIHVLLGERVIADPDNGFALYHMLAAALQVTRGGKDMSEDVKQGYIKIFEEAIDALEFMRSDPAHT